MAIELLTDRLRYEKSTQYVLKQHVIKTEISSSSSRATAGHWLIKDGQRKWARNFELKDL